MTVTPPIKDVLREELVLIHPQGDTAEEILRAVADLLLADGAVKETYFDAMWERETKYPTGLPTQEVRVAMPHADVEHVNYSALGVAILDHPVRFIEMGTADSPLDVEIVLVLANADPAEQVQTLRRLIDLFDEPSHLHELKDARTPAEAIKVLRRSYE